MLGLVRRAVSLVNHDPDWTVEAEKTISLLAKILQTDMIDAQHVGSTAISGICAKPIIDIAVGVNSFQDIMKHNSWLKVHGVFYWKPEHGEQLLYVCGDLKNEFITHHIHVVIWQSEPWKNYLNFRDYMNCHEKEAKEYAEIKERLAELYSKDRSSYTAGKQEFIERILQKSRAWRDRSRRNF